MINILTCEHHYINIYFLFQGKHGLHIHVFGDFTESFITCGGIFNPFGKNHGSPDDEERMVGSLGKNLILVVCSSS